MLFLLSPAKSLDYERALPAAVAHTLPTFLAQAGVLIEQLRGLSAQELGAKSIRNARTMPWGRP